MEKASGEGIDLSEKIEVPRWVLPALFLTGLTIGILI